MSEAKLRCRYRCGKCKGEVVQPVRWKYHWCEKCDREMDPVGVVDE